MKKIVKNHRPQRKTKTPQGWTVTDFRDRTLTDLRLYFRSTDWSALWSDWYLSVDETNRPKYKQIRSFIAQHAESQPQADFLSWYLGPVIDNDDRGKKYPFVQGGPVDWVGKRKHGGWFSEQNLYKFSAEIRRRITALDALREAGNGITLHSLVRAEQLAQKLDEAFKGEIFIPGMSLIDNITRANSYIGLHERIQNLKAQAQDLYAKSHGVNFEDMSGLVQLMTAAAMASAQNPANQEPTREQRAITKLVSMTLAKSSRYNLPLPTDAEAKIVEATAEPVPINRRKKDIQ